MILEGKNNFYFLSFFLAKIAFLLVLSGSTLQAKEYYAEKNTSAAPSKTAPSRRQSSYQVTAEEYCCFLNDIAKRDPYGFYNEKMGYDPLSACISRRGYSSNYRYEVIAGREKFPINYVSRLDQEGFCNWLQNRNSPNTLGSNNIEREIYIFNDSDNDDEIIHHSPSSFYCIADHPAKDTSPHFSSSISFFSITSNSVKLSMFEPSAAESGSAAVTEEAANILELMALLVAGGKIFPGIEDNTLLMEKAEETSVLLRERSEMAHNEAETHELFTRNLDLSIRKNPKTISDDNFHQLLTAHHITVNAWKTTLSIYEEALTKAITRTHLDELSRNIQKIRASLAIWSAATQSLEYEKNMHLTGALFHQAIVNYSEKKWNNFLRHRSLIFDLLVTALDAQKKALTYAITETQKNTLHEEIIGLQEQIDQWAATDRYTEKAKNQAIEQSLKIAEHKRTEAAKAPAIKEKQLQKEIQKKRTADQKATEKRRQAEKKALAVKALQEEHDRLAQQTLSAEEEALKTAGKEWAIDIIRSREEDKTSFLERWYHQSYYMDDFSDFISDCIAATKESTSRYFSYSSRHWNLLKAQSATQKAIKNMQFDLKNNPSIIEEAKIALEKFHSLLEALPENEQAAWQKQIHDTNQLYSRYYYLMLPSSIETFKTANIALEARDQARGLKASDALFESSWKEAEKAAARNIEASNSRISNYTTIKGTLTADQLADWQKEYDTALYNHYCYTMAPLWINAQHAEAIANKLHDQALATNSKDNSFELIWRQAIAQTKKTAKAWDRLIKKHTELKLSLPTSMHESWDGNTHRNINIETASQNFISSTAKPLLMESQKKEKIALKALLDQDSSLNLKAKDAEDAWQKTIEKCHELRPQLMPTVQILWDKEIDTLEKNKIFWTKLLQNKTT